MEQRNEPETECCHRCGKEILKGAHVCDACAHVIDCEQLEAMERNEPSTEEIVRALRCDGDASNCVDCRYATYDTATILCDQEQNVRDAAARLEQLERENAELKSRAEKAEADRDAAVNALTLYEDALFDECDKSYQSGFVDGFQSREEIDDED